MNPDPAYRLGTGDTVHVTVFGESDLSGDYPIDGTGVMRLPLIGQIRAAGLTIPALENSIQAKLAEGYLRDPKVSAQVTNYRPFYIIGEVNKPGEYPYVNGMNVLTAVALAGGFTYRADDSDVDIRHKGSDKEVSVPVDPSSKVDPGDIITVSERFF
ncbi:MAG: polysaccharide export protein [Alphaproteobacteria bacterium]|nr:polysaccharide export protein [Alphaproteobacteria bacterium]MDE2013561.1 polysaccharide export protein [Alphaproteobacteria bacterium]MDE2073623.1 polysaccharide export protein [Alphaproteobacteria bacterium]